jgi:hypothetical protein
MKEIPLTKGYVALVNDSDYAKVAVLEWSTNIRRDATGKIIHIQALHNGRTGRFSMHRFILGITDPEIKVDHKDHNGLNNQKYNLRPCSHTQNVRNRLPRRKGEPKGIYWDRGKWRTRITVNSKTIHLGRFESKLEAAKAYDKAAVEFFGEFACTNTMLGLLGKD